MSPHTTSLRSLSPGGGLLLAIGIVAAAALLAAAVRDVRAHDRYVTVRGLAERDVAADLAVWPVRYSVTADDLPALHAALERDGIAVRRFLEARDFTANDLQPAPPVITDFRGRAASAAPPPQRYLGEATLTLRSSRVEDVREAYQAARELVAAGVALAPGYPGGPVYLFTGLSGIKPGMIAEATRDARRAASRFAEDSGSRVGGIRHARQGYFSIEDRDRWDAVTKRVRVVTTIDYFLVE